jgi:hypothetical protein
VRGEGDAQARAGGLEGLVQTRVRIVRPVGGQGGIVPKRLRLRSWSVAWGPRVGGYYLATRGRDVLAKTCDMPLPTNCLENEHTPNSSRLASAKKARLY